METMIEQIKKESDEAGKIIAGHHAGKELALAYLQFNDYEKGLAIYPG